MSEQKQLHFHVKCDNVSVRIMLLVLRIYLQLYTVRKAARKDLWATLQKISDVGYNGVEAARIEFDKNSAEILTKAKENFGLEVVGSQITYDKLAHDFSKTLDFLNSTNCKNAIVSVLPPEYLFKGEDGLKMFSEKLNVLGCRYKNEGVRLSFHHHDFEFLKYGKRFGIDILLKETDPSCVYFVSDTYWAQKGGVCPTEFIEKLGNRLNSIHLRDYKLSRRVLGIKPMDCVIGTGMLNVNGIIEECQKQNIKFLSVEQNSKNPFVDIAESFEFIKALQICD